MTQVAQLMAATDGMKDANGGTEMKANTWRGNHGSSQSRPPRHKADQRSTAGLAAVVPEAHDAAVEHRSGIRLPPTAVLISSSSYLEARTATAERREARAGAATEEVFCIIAAILLLSRL